MTSIYVQELRFPAIMTLVIAGLWNLTVMAHNGQEAHRGYYPAPDPTLFARLQALSRAEDAKEQTAAAPSTAEAPQVTSLPYEDAIEP